MAKAPKSMSINEFLLSKLKEGSIDFPQKEEFLEQLKNEMKDNPTKTLLYNIYTSTHCKLSPAQKYQLYLSLKNDVCPIPIDCYEPVYYLYRCDTEDERILLAVRYKWYRLDIFQFNTPFCAICKMLKTIESRGYSIECFDQTQEKTNNNDKFLHFIFDESEIIGLTSNTFTFLQINDTYELAKSISQIFKIKIQFHKYDSMTHIIQELSCDYIAWKFLSNIDYYNKYKCYHLVDSLIDRANRGLEKFPECISAIKEIYIHCKDTNNVFAGDDILEQFPELSFSSYLKQFSLGDPFALLKYYNETNVWGKFPYPIISPMPELKTELIVKWSNSTKENFDWLLHLAHFSYIIYLLNMGSGLANQKLQETVDFSYYGIEDCFEKAVNEYYTKMIPTPEFLHYQNIRECLFDREEYPTALLKVIDEILQKYPIDMALVLPGYDYNIFSKYVYRYFNFMNKKNGVNLEKVHDFDELKKAAAGARKYNKSDMDKLIKLCDRFLNEEIELRSNPNRLSNYLELIPILGLAKTFKLYDHSNPIRPIKIYSIILVGSIVTLFTNIMRLDNVSIEKKEFNEFIKESPLINNKIRSMLKEISYSSSKSIIDRIEKISKFAEDQKLNEYSLKFIENSFHSLSDSSFDELDSFLKYVYESIVDPSEEKNIKQKCREIISSKTKTEQISLSSQFAQYLVSFLRAMPPPMLKPDPNALQFNKQQIFSIIKETAPYLLFTEANKDLYQLIYIDSPTLTIRNRKNKKYYTYHEMNGPLLFLIDKMFPKEAYVFEEANPEYFDLRLPAKIVSQGVNFNKLAKISEEIISKFSHANKDDVDINEAIKMLESARKDQKLIKQLKEFNEKVQKAKRIENLRKNLNLSKQITTLIDRSNSPNNLFFYGNNSNLRVDKIDSQIVSNFSKIEIMIPELLSIQSSPLEIKILTNINNPSVSLSLNIDSSIIFDMSSVTLSFDTKSLPKMNNYIEGVLHFESLNIPVQISINKLDTEAYIKCEGISLYFDEEHNRVAFNPIELPRDHQIKISTFGTTFSRIPHQLSFQQVDNSEIPDVNYDKEKNESSIVLKDDSILVMTVKLGNDFSTNILIDNDIANSSMTMKYFNRMTGKFEEMPEYLYAGILCYRYYFYLNVSSLDPSDELVITINEGDLLYVKDSKYNDKIFSFDICFIHQTERNATLKFHLSSKSKRIDQDISIDFVFADIHIFETSDNKIAFEPRFKELDNLEYFYHDYQNNRWLPIKPQELIDPPPFRFIVISQFTYNWISLSNEYNIETYIDYSSPRLLPDHINNFCFFVIQGQNYRIVHEDEFNPATMKKLCIRLCDEPYRPDEGKDVWNNCWAPVQSTVDYVDDVLSLLNLNNLVMITKKLIEFIKILNIDQFNKIKNMKDKTKFIHLIKDIFDKRLHTLSQTRFQLRLPLKIEDVFKGQKIINDKYVFTNSALKDIPHENQTVAKKSTKIRTPKKAIPEDMTFDALKISDNISDYNSKNIIEKPEEKARYDFGENIFDPESLSEINLNSIKSLDNIDSIISAATDICIKLPYLIKKSNENHLDQNLSKCFAFLKSLKMQIGDNYEACNPILAKAFTDSFDLLSSQIGTEKEREQVAMNSLSLPESFYSEKNLAGLRVVAQKAKQPSPSASDKEATIVDQSKSQTPQSDEFVYIPVDQNQVGMGFIPVYPPSKTQNNEEGVASLDDIQNGEILIPVAPDNIPNGEVLIPVSPDKNQNGDVFNPVSSDAANNNQGGDAFIPISPEVMQQNLQMMNMMPQMQNGQQPGFGFIPMPMMMNPQGGFGFMPMQSAPQGDNQTNQPQFMNLFPGFGAPMMPFMPQGFNLNQMNMPQQGNNGPSGLNNPMMMNQGFGFIPVDPSQFGFTQQNMMNTNQTQQQNETANKEVQQPQEQNIDQDNQQQTNPESSQQNVETPKTETQQNQQPQQQNTNPENQQPSFGFQMPDAKPQSHEQNSPEQNINFGFQMPYSTPNQQQQDQNPTTESQQPFFGFGFQTPVSTPQPQDQTQANQNQIFGFQTPTPNPNQQQQEQNATSENQQSTFGFQNLPNQTQNSATEQQTSSFGFQIHPQSQQQTQDEKTSQEDQSKEQNQTTSFGFQNPLQNPDQQQTQNEKATADGQMQFPPGFMPQNMPGFGFDQSSLYSPGFGFNTVDQQQFTGQQDASMQQQTGFGFAPNMYQQANQMYMNQHQDDFGFNQQQEQAENDDDDFIDDDSTYI